MAVIGPLEMQMILGLDGANEAEGGIKRVRQEIDKTTDATEDNTLAGVRNAQQQTNTFLALQALTSGLNQLSGGMNKVSGSLIASGGQYEEWGTQLQSLTRRAELLTGSLEIGIAAMNVYTGAMLFYTGSALEATVATWGLNAALAANPLIMFAVAAVAVISILIALELKFKMVTTTVEGLTVALKELVGWLDAVFSKVHGFGFAIGENIRTRGGGGGSVGSTLGGGAVA